MDSVLGWFGSAHQDHWYAAFCDGSVHPIGYDTPLDIHRAVLRIGPMGCQHRVAKTPKFLLACPAADLGTSMRPGSSVLDLGSSGILSQRLF